MKMGWRQWRGNQIILDSTDTVTVTNERNDWGKRNAIQCVYTEMKYT